MRSAYCLFFLALVSLSLTLGCSCDECQPPLELQIPLLNSTTDQAVTFKVRRENSTTNVITCNWSSGWQCSPKPSSSSITPPWASLEFSVNDAKSDWVVEVQGPSGTTTVTLTAESTDPGEGWPTDCPCYPYRAKVTTETMTTVGATL